MTAKIIIAAVMVTGSVAVLAGCSPRDLETPPIVVQTVQGPVTCQLYTLDEVYWDRSIGRPEGMQVETADGICRAEGMRILQARKK